VDRTACTEPQCLYKGALLLMSHSLKTICFKESDRLEKFADYCFEM